MIVGVVTSVLLLIFFLAWQAHTRKIEALYAELEAVCGPANDYNERAYREMMDTIEWPNAE